MNRPAPKQGQQSVAKEFLLFLSIPLGVILILAVVLQGPSLFAKPKYDFIYSECQGYTCEDTYVVNAGGQLILNQADNSFGSASKPTLYYYSESQHAAKQILPADATNYTLNSSNVSPDGYTLWQNNGSDSGFVFWDSSSDGNWYLKNGIKKKPLNLGSANNYGSQVNFIGWVRQ